MGWLDRLRGKKEPVTKQEVRKAVHMAMTNRSKQTEYKWEKQWSMYEQVLSRKTYSDRQIIDNLKVIRDLNPDASMAIWNLIRLINTGFEVEGLRPDGTVDDNMTMFLEDLTKRIGRLYGGGADQLISVWVLSGYTSGAIACEAELSDNLREVVDIHPVEPMSIDFQYKTDEGLVMVQRRSDGQLVELNSETVFYYPIDPDVGDPHGRSPLLPILQIVFFQTQILADLQKVLHHQGHERFDISIVEEAIINAMPDELKYDIDKVQQYVDDYISQIEKGFQDLNPDDDFIHSDSVSVTMVGGASKGVMDAKAVIEVINQQIVSALKMLPILLGRNEGTTETHGTVQWQIFMSGVKNLQRIIKRMLERALNVALQLEGYQGRARITFNETSVRNAMQEAQADQTRTTTLIQQVQQGWITNDEAANQVVGHDAVGTPQAPSTSNPLLDAFRPPASSRSTETKVHYSVKK